MIVDDVLERARNLKALIEFMDVPQVQIVTPEGWRDEVRDRRIAAVFLSDALGQDRMQRVIRELGELDPNVPIVLVEDEDAGRASC